MTTPFPLATIVGYPRIGPDRELKSATENYWRGNLSEAGLRAAVEDLRDGTYARLSALGLDPGGYAIPESFSLYDQVLDTAVALGAIPSRYAGLSGLDLYFTLARGSDELGALEMTKWFDTNYHYLVPELEPGTAFSLADAGKIEEFKRARNLGYLVRPTLVGPVTFLALSKSAEGVDQDWSPLSLLPRLVDAYAAILTAFADEGAAWVQFDEPALTSDNLGADRDELIELATQAWSQLAAQDDRPQVLVTLPYGDGSSALEGLASTGIDAIQVDFRRTQDVSDEAIEALGEGVLVAGVVEGRNIWRADLREAVGILEALQARGANLSASTATSLQHVPVDLDREQWADANLNDALHEWLAFADQKVREVVLLGLGLTEGWAVLDGPVTKSDESLAHRAAFPGVVREEVRQRTDQVVPSNTEREATEVRQQAQADALGLPALPITTIGSFPQTAEIRRARAAYARGDLDAGQYRDAMRAEVASVVALQEELGLDVLVHGEPERNDMVQYFAEQLDGYAATRHGWVQSYGTRCTRPSVLWGDVARPEPMTVEWATYAASLTNRPVKGMLTGPTTMIAWSFPREDLPFADVAAQIGLALRDEVGDLEAAGIKVIQVDEPALRELLPLDAVEHQTYLDAAVRAFRLATSGVAPQTQIHTHLCYSEFGQILSAILALNADVTSIEAARSRMELLGDLDGTDFHRGLGPGVWDIHSPRVPEVPELVELLRAALGSVDAESLWVNPDCGLKTRGYDETVASLRNLVAAATRVRGELTPPLS